MEAEKLREHKISPSANRPLLSLAVPRLYTFIAFAAGVLTFISSGIFCALAVFAGSIVFAIWLTSRDVQFPFVLIDAFMSAVRGESLFSPFVIKSKKIRWKKT